MTVIESIMERFGLTVNEAQLLSEAVVAPVLDAFDHQKQVIVFNPLTRRKDRGIDIAVAAERIKARRKQLSPEPQPAESQPMLQPA